MRPASNHAEKLSVVDVSKIDSKTGDQLLEAASKWGFLYVRNHGFTAEGLERTFDLVSADNRLVARSGVLLSNSSVAPIFQVSP